MGNSESESGWIECGHCRQPQLRAAMFETSKFCINCLLRTGYRTMKARAPYATRKRWDHSWFASPANSDKEFWNEYKCWPCGEWLPLQSFVRLLTEEIYPSCQRCVSLAGLKALETKTKPSSTVTTPIIKTNASNPKSQPAASAPPLYQEPLPSDTTSNPGIAIEKRGNGNIEQREGAVVNPGNVDTIKNREGAIMNSEKVNAIENCQGETGIEDESQPGTCT